MHRRVNFYVAGEFQSKDLRDIQAFEGEGVAAAAADGIGPGSYYSGLRVAKGGPTSLQVEPGRLLRAGQFYSLPRAESLPGTLGAVLQVGANLPIVQNKIIALCVWGRVIDTQVEQRSFRLDLTTDAIEFKSVPVVKHYEAVLEVVDDGTESATPTLPVIPDGLLHFCTVWLDPDGITKIEMVQANQLPAASDLAEILRMIAIWRARIEAQVDALRVQMAALREMQFNFARHRDVINMAADVALLKQLAQLPAGTSSYAADGFGDDSLSDLAYSGYDARIDHGLLFPIEATASIDLALLSPNDASAMIRDGLLLPAYESVHKFSSGTWDGQDVAMAVEQSSWEYETIEFDTWENVKGWSFNHYAQWWSSLYARYGQVDYRYKGSGLSKESYVSSWLNNWNMNWQLKPVEVEVLKEGSATQVAGAAIAQTFVAPTMWLTEVELFFTSVQPFDVRIWVCKVSETGKPIFDQAMATSLKAHGDLAAHPVGTRFLLSRPIFLQSGERYAIVVLSEGLHRLATVSASDFTEGTFFTGTSGDFFQGDQSTDLKFSLYGAKFNNPRTVISLQPISLAGGITDLKLLSSQHVPNGCNLEIQYQVGGIWHQFNEGEFPLASAPSLLPLRAVFVGSSASHAALVIGGVSKAHGSRSKLTLTHVSKSRSLATAAQTFIVKLRTYQYIQGTHSLTCNLLEGENTHSSDTAIAVLDQDGSTLHTFTFELGAAISSYRLQLIGTRPNATTMPFVVVERIEVTA